MKKVIATTLMIAAPALAARWYPQIYMLAAGQWNAPPPKIKVELRSDDPFLARVPGALDGAEFAPGETIACGSWIKQEALDKAEALARAEGGDDFVNKWYESVGQSIKCFANGREAGAYGGSIELK